MSGPAASGLLDHASDAALKAFLQQTTLPNVERLAAHVVLFGAEFHDAARKGGAMDAVLLALSRDASRGFGKWASFSRCDAEALADSAEALGVEMVPTFVVVRPGNMKVLDVVVGAEPSELTTKLARLQTSLASASAAPSAPAAKSAPSSGAQAAAATLTPREKEVVFARIRQLVASADVFVFIKGTIAEPKCKFTKQLLALFATAGVTKFASFNILTDDAIRAGVKEFSSWPTFPQVFAHGKLVGGVDIIDELVKSGELLEQLAPPPPVQAADPSAVKGPSSGADMEERLKALVKQSPVMLFMKGTPDAPNCGFSSKIVSILKSHNVVFGSFDILSDDDVRQALKKFSNWPTYPQLYANGNLVGGLDIVAELAESGELLGALNDNHFSSSL